MHIPIGIILLCIMAAAFVIVPSPFLFGPSLLSFLHASSSGSYAVIYIIGTGLYLVNNKFIRKSLFLSFGLRFTAPAACLQAALASNRPASGRRKRYL